MGVPLALIGGGIVGVPLALIGGGIGAVRGQREVYRFPKRSPSQNRKTAPPRRPTETVERQEK